MHKKITITRTRPTADIPWFADTEAFKQLVDENFKNKLRQLNQLNVYRSSYLYPSELELVQVIEVFNEAQLNDELAPGVELYSDKVVPGAEEEYNQSVGITISYMIEEITD